MAEHGKAVNQVNSHTKSGADQGSAFHCSCRTRTAKLCSRICPRCEFCTRSFWHSYVFMKYVLPTLFGEKRKIRSAVRLSPRPFPIGVGTKKCIDERSAPGGGFPLSEKYHRRNFGFYTVFFMIQKRSRFFFAFPIGQGDRACGARVLPSKAKMRQTLFASASSFFIPLGKH